MTELVVPFEGHWCLLCQQRIPPGDTAAHLASAHPTPSDLAGAVAEADELFRVAMGLPSPLPLGYRAAQVAARIQQLEGAPVIGPEDDSEIIYGELEAFDPHRADVNYWMSNYNPNLPRHLWEVAAPFQRLAVQLFEPLEGDEEAGDPAAPLCPDDVLAARLLVLAKDAAVRAAVWRHQQQQQEATGG